MGIAGLAALLFPVPSLHLPHSGMDTPHCGKRSQGSENSKLSEEPGAVTVMGGRCLSDAVLLKANDW